MKKMMQLLRAEALTFGNEVLMEIVNSLLPMISLMGIVDGNYW
jgi:hypothetical protein